MSATNYTQITARLRVDGNDTVASNPIFRETPVGERDGANTIFKLNNQNIVTGIISTVQYGPWLTYGTTKRSLSAGAAPFTLDALNGIVTITTPPDSGATKPFFFDYYFNWFVDSDYQSMIDEATEELGAVAGVAVSENLFPALVQYSLERYWLRRASVYANKYASSAGGASEQIQSVCQNFLGLAKNARKNGDALRVNAYSDPGGKKKPSSYTITTQISPYTPRR